ncbi:paraquat-inducible protein A [Marinobacter sp.]|uniref:paraquat-inducible protein A n=1 Tax=Marinobacter sp. TaxID=50741 RepID=UPI002B492F80|nr:paraquat-inducible protein A [Marinobacter sp.]HKK57007.1 paraquat-inducible protein A [Marinobacter sp.]
MSESTQLVICEYCDSVYERQALDRHQRAHCQRCGALLDRHPWLGVDQLLALSATAGILLAFVCFYPILRIYTRDQSGSATLLEAVLALFDGSIGLIGVTAAFGVILVPAAQIGLLIWLLAFARKQRHAPGFQPCMRLLEVLRPWSMLEVFLLGALVAVVKLTGRIDTAPAAGLFALAALSLLMVGVAGRDIRMLWDQLS